MTFNPADYIKDEADLYVWYKEDMVYQIKRHPFLKYLYGYVCLPEEHPLFNDDFDDYEVHGGITCQQKVQGKEWGIKDEKMYKVLGFDCAHAGDLAPYLLNGLPQYFEDQEIYRDVPYVLAEIESLATQIRARAKRDFKILYTDDEVIILKFKENNYYAFPMDRYHNALKGENVYTQFIFEESDKLKEVDFDSIDHPELIKALEEFKRND